MSAQFMRRSIRISVRLTEEEHRLLKEKMARIGVTNQEAFLRTIHKTSIRGASSSFKINFIVVHVLSGFIVSGDGHGGKDAEYLLKP